MFKFAATVIVSLGSSGYGDSLAIDGGPFVFETADGLIAMLQCRINRARSEYVRGARESTPMFQIIWGKDEGLTLASTGNHSSRWANGNIITFDGQVCSISPFTPEFKKFLTKVSGGNSMHHARVDQRIDYDEYDANSEGEPWWW